jgi:uncharacterized membrane protein YgcG
MAEVAASVWWDKDHATALPTRQKVGRGDALDFFATSYFLHPVTWRVHVAKNANVDEGESLYKVPIETGNVLVDVMGGEELPLPRSEKMRHSIASEMLVMDEFGGFSVKNDMEDSTMFRNLLFLPDENSTVGQKRRKKKKKSGPGNDSRGDGGGGKFGGGGGMGGGFGDDF